MLPGTLQLGWNGDGELAGAISLDENGVVLDDGEQVEAATLIQVGEEGKQNGFPGAGAPPVLAWG